ncbi:MAG TPA: helix-turn-helix transcriptional regulator [Armatimonadota bacterium]|nr:helix-turn-helix transcriptional regulator [Armatimonadota bacterium]
MTLMDLTRRARELKTVQTLLRDLRQEAGLTQWDLAARLQMPQSFVSKFEAGTRRLDICELRRVLDALDVTLETFLQQLDARLRD